MNQTTGTTTDASDERRSTQFNLRTLFWVIFFELETTECPPDRPARQFSLRQLLSGMVLIAISLGIAVSAVDAPIALMWFPYLALCCAALKGYRFEATLGAYLLCVIVLVWLLLPEVRIVR